MIGNEIEIIIVEVEGDRVKLGINAPKHIDIHRKEIYVAIQEELGFKRIDTLNIYGIEVWASFDESEYKEQTPCIDFWIPFLYGKGIQVMIPAYLLYAGRTKNNMYGYVRKGEKYV